MITSPVHCLRRLSPAELRLPGVGYGVCDRCGVAGRVDAELWCSPCAGGRPLRTSRPPGGRARIARVLA